MKQIELKKLGLLNFKGARNVEIAFNGNTTISGDNGTGKSTIFDAFTWLLFGKNADDKKDFSVKTYDENGEIIPRLPHEVSAVILVDGKEVVLRRILEERWTKKRGSAVEEFTGNTEKRFWDEVPCNVSEWNAKVAELIPEQTFKIITNPLYFTSLKQDVQRNILMEMAGEISESELIGGNQQFGQIISDCGGKTVEEYKRQIQSKKRIVKDAIDSIPSRIDEVKRTIVEVEKTKNELDNELNEVFNEERKLDAMVANDEQAIKANSAEVEALNKTISKISGEISSRQFEIRQQLTENYYKAKSKVAEIENQINGAKSKIDVLEQTNAKAKESIQANEAKKNELKNEFVAIRAKKLEFNENDFVCPTCKRPLEPSEIEHKQAEMQSNFNADKVARLSKINERGQALNAEIDELTKQIADNEKQISLLQCGIDSGNDEIESINLSPVSDEEIEACIQNDKKIEELKQSVENAQKELASIRPVERSVDLSVINEQRAALRDRTNAANASKYALERNRNAEKRIEELEIELRSNNEELARLEGIEFTIQGLQKRKVSLVEERIASYFKKVRWKMFDTQINGGEVECCIPMVDGIPFADANKTGKIHAGIDILNAMSKQMGVSAPVFIDNAESYNSLPECDSQIIRLVVSNEKQLTTK